MAGNELTPDQMDILVQFQDLTGIEDFERCRTLMDNHNWDLESAVQDCFNDAPIPPPQINREVHERTPAVNINPPDQRVLTVVQRNLGWTDWSYALVSFPFRFIYSSIFSLFGYLYRMLRRDNMITPRNPELDVRKFVDKFEETYGHQHPNFYRGSYSQALNEAKRELKFLLIYLHNENNRDVPVFCRATICSEEFTTFVNSNMLFWACSIDQTEGSKVSQALRNNVYPFMALIVLKQNRMTVIAKIQGPHETNSLIGQLIEIMDANRTGLREEQRDREERHFNMTLRQQQDEAYQLSLSADREKERKKREHEEEVERRYREEEEESRLEKERADQRHLEVIKIKEEIRSTIPSEPDTGHPDTIRVLLKLPNGSRLERRFNKNDTVQRLHDFVFIHESAPNDFEIIKSHPRMNIPCNKDKYSPSSSSTQSCSDREDNIPTFAEMGFGKCELLHVHDNEA